MSEPDFHFTFHFSNLQYPLSQDTDICDKYIQLWFGIICHKDKFQNQAHKFIKN